LIVGEPSKNILISIKRFSFVKEFHLTFKFPAPEIIGKHTYNIYLLCDSWIGCDQEEKFEINIID
jgi:pre-mRNA-splicing helicase BRR2